LRRYRLRRGNIGYLVTPTRPIAYGDAEVMIAGGVEAALQKWR